MKSCYHFVIHSVAKDLGNTYLMYSRFFAFALNDRTKSLGKVAAFAEKSLGKVAAFVEKSLGKVYICTEPVRCLAFKGIYNIGYSEQIITLPLYMGFLLTER